MSTNLATVPVWAWVALGVLGLVEIALDVFALVDLYRRPTKQVVLGNKWIWVVIVLLVNMLGAIIYLAIGRKPAAIEENGPRSASSTAGPQDIGDALYGPRKTDDRDQR
jgi:cytochrome bd-type quinol oxidase subunit 1